MKALTLRLPDEIHEQLRREAFDRRVSITSLIVDRLRAKETESDWEYGVAAHYPVTPERQWTALPSESLSVAEERVEELKHEHRVSAWLVRRHKAGPWEPVEAGESDE